VEFARAKRAGYPCCVAAVRLYELEQLRENLGAARLESTTVPAVTQILDAWATKLDLTGRASDGTFLLVVPEQDLGKVDARLSALCREIGARALPGPIESVRLTPVAGYADDSQAADAEDLLACARTALASAAASLELKPVRFTPAMRGSVPNNRRGSSSLSRTGLLWAIALLFLGSAAFVLRAYWSRTPPL
jgi:GGDEF domain-containing protein